MHTYVELRAVYIPLFGGGPRRRARAGYYGCRYGLPLYRMSTRPP
jgi:hypothetical protein